MILRRFSHRPAATLSHLTDYVYSKNIFRSPRRRISFKGAVSEAEVRDSSVEMLQSYLTSIIESIVGSVDQCPPVMRVAFKQLHKRVEEQFAEPENEVRQLQMPSQSASMCLLRVV